MSFWPTLVKYPPQFHAKIIGKLLGDGSITKQTNRQARFQFSHMLKDKSWAVFCYENLKMDCPLADPYYRKIIDKRLNKGYSENITVQSKTSEIFNVLKQLWYQDHKKIIPFNYIKTYFNTTSLVWWYQDDGHLTLTNNAPSKIILSTECFTLTEIHQLQTFLGHRFKLQFHVDKQKRLILYDSTSVHYFLSIIKSELHPSMYRKTLKQQYIHSLHHASKRSTIYLPTSISIVKPTRDINNQLNYLTNIWDRYKQERFYTEIYLFNLQLLDTTPELKGYQIVINKKHLDLLWVLKKNTGLTYSQLTLLCFHLK